MKTIWQITLCIMSISIFLHTGTVFADANHAPVATDQTLNTDRNKEIAITLTGTDEDGDALNYQLVSLPENGKVNGTAPIFKYTPNANFVGSDTFTFKVSDGNLDSAAVTITINVDMPQNKVLKGWWGDFNTADYNDVNMADVLNEKPNIHKLDPLTSTFYPPSGEYIEKKNGVIQIGWVLYKPDLNSPITQSGGVGGGNRTVFSKGSGTAGTDYRQVWGYFAEPDVSKVNFQRPTNKPTYYFGLEGAINGLNVGSDCGIQWEPAFTDKEDASNNTEAGWTLVNRPTLRYIDRGSAENDYKARPENNYTWGLFKQYKLPGKKIAHRFPKRTLNTLLIGYVIDQDNNAEISLSNGAKLSASYGNPQYPIRVDSLRRNVGLTQQLTNKERDSDSNAYIIPDVASMYLDGSVVSGLKFGNGHLKTFPKLDADDPVQTDDAWSVRGGSGILRPPNKIDGKWVVDFTEYDPSTAHPRPADSLGTTDFNYEDVIITMGAKKKTHKVESKPKKRN